MRNPIRVRRTASPARQTCVRWAALCGLLALGAGLAAAPAEKLVVTSKVEPLAKGRGRVVLAFQADPRYHFNRTPPITVEIEAVPGIDWDRTRQLPKDGKPVQGSQYFGKILPVEFTYILAPTARPEARLKVTYFYCSKKDGYCARESKPLVIPLPPSS